MKLKQQKLDIALLQETNLTDAEHSKLRKEWIGQLVIRVNKHCAFQLQSQGRFVIIQGYIDSVPMCIINVYGPNYDNPTFLSRLFFLN